MITRIVMTLKQIKKTADDVLSVNEMSEKYQIILLGESWTGKSNLFTRILKNSFSLHSYGTIAINSANKMISILSNQINTSVTFYDVSGRKSYWDNEIISQRSLNGAILVYDITNRESFEAIDDWRHLILQLFPNISLCLVGNKCDLDDLRVVTSDQAEEYAKKSSISLFAEVSAKTGIGIPHLIESFVTELHNRYLKSITPLESFDVVESKHPSHNSKERSSLRYLNELFVPLDSNNHITMTEIDQTHDQKQSIMSHRDSDDGDEGERLVSQKLARDNSEDNLLAHQRLQQAVPVCLSGIAGGYGSYVNGIYIPSSEFQNGWPIYRRIDHTAVIHEKFKEMFLCFDVPVLSTAELKDKPERKKKKAWIIKNSEGITFARCRLPDVPESSNIPPEKVQFNEQGIRKDIYWEMKSSVDVFGFRKRPGGIMRPASFSQLTALPELKDDILEISRPTLSAILSSGEMDDVHPPLLSDPDHSSHVNSIYRVILLGESGVGKTSLIHRFHDQTFTPIMEKSVGVDISTSEIECLDGRCIKCQIWDTSGDHKYWKLLNVYLRYPLGGVAGVLLLYDISNRKSFEMIEYWIQLLQSLSILTPLLFHLIGTKSDMDDYSARQVTFEEGIAFAEKYSISSFVETSAYDGTGVVEVFQQIFTDLICFDENARKWMKSTKPTYRRRTIALVPHSNTSLSHERTLKNPNLDYSRRYSFSGNGNASEDTSNDVSNVPISSPIEIELVKRTPPKKDHL